MPTFICLPFATLCFTTPTPTLYLDCWGGRHLPRDEGGPPSVVDTAVNSEKLAPTKCVQAIVLTLRFTYLLAWPAHFTGYFACALFTGFPGWDECFDFICCFLPLPATGNSSAWALFYGIMWNIPSRPCCCHRTVASLQPAYPALWLQATTAAVAGGVVCDTDLHEDDRASQPRNTHYRMALPLISKNTTGTSFR